MVATSDLKTCMVVNSEIIFFSFISDLNIYLQKYEIPLSGISFASSRHRKGETIYFTCRI